MTSNTNNTPSCDSSERVSDVQGEEVSAADVAAPKEQCGR